MPDLTMMSAVDLTRHYRRKTLSPVEVLKSVLDRIDCYEGIINAFCHLDYDAAMAAAYDSESRWNSGTPLGPIDGVPTTIKDALMAKGWPTRRGSLTCPAEGTWIEDSASTSRLRENGAILLGKTTMPEYGWKGVTDSPLTGVTRNPWNIRLSPGGSSGGAAAACSLGMGTLHVGTDGAGSIRMPAAFTGIYGLKPTFGRVPIFPLKIPSTIIHHGPMTRTVTDAALMLTIMSEPDPRDCTAMPYSPRDWRIGLEDGVKGLRIAYSRDFGYVDVNPQISELVEKAAHLFSDLGATVEETDPGFKCPYEAFKAYYYMGYKFLIEMMDDSQRSVLDPGLLRSVNKYAKFGLMEYMSLKVEQLRLGQHMSDFHQKYDLLISPQMPIIPFETGVEVPKNSNMDGWMDWSPFTYPFNFTQQPAASLPCGITDEGLPAAIQVVGPLYREDLVLRASRAYEAIYPFKMPPLPKNSNL